MANKVKLADQLYSTLRQLVESGEWPEGTRIVPETALARQHKVSRPVVREALIRLRADGLVDSRQGSGNFVTSGVEKGGYRPIENVASLIESFEFRLSVECDVAALAALRRTSENLDTIHQAAAGLNVQANDESFGDADFGFHLALAQASQNVLYLTTLNMLRNQIIFGMRLVGEFAQQRAAARVDVVLEEHQAVVTAVTAHNPGAAHAAMGRHLMNSHQRLFGFDIPIDWQRGSVEEKKAAKGCQSCL